MRKIIVLLFFCLNSVLLFPQTDTSMYENDKKSGTEMGLVVENNPEFIGGQEAYYRYVESHAVYTKKALRDGAEGTVFMSLLIDEKGKIERVKILKGLHPDLDSISYYLVKNMPDWLPAKNRGKPIKWMYYLPITYCINGRESIKQPSPSGYWVKKGKKLFYKKCLNEYGKTQEECDCWNKFIIWNDKYSLNDPDLKEMFDKQKCK